MTSIQVCIKDIHICSSRCTFTIAFPEKTQKPTTSTTRIDQIYRIIKAIGKHVVAQQALTGRYKCIRIDESTDVRIVISGLEIVQTGLLEMAVAIQLKISLFLTLGFQPIFWTIGFQTTSIIVQREQDQPSSLKSYLRHFSLLKSRYGSTTSAIALIQSNF